MHGKGTTGSDLVYGFWGQRNTFSGPGFSENGWNYFLQGTEIKAEKTPTYNLDRRSKLL